MEEVNHLDLIMAIAIRDLDGVQKVLNEGASVESSDHRGYTALILAAHGDDADSNADLILTELLKGGAVVNRAMVRSDRTALHFAAMYGYRGGVSLLINHGAEVDKLDHQKASALFYAIQRGALGCVKELLQAGANPNLCKGRFRCIEHAFANVTRLLRPYVVPVNDGSSNFAITLQAFLELKKAHETEDLNQCEDMLELASINVDGLNSTLEFVEDLIGAFEIIALLVCHNADYCYRRVLGQQEQVNLCDEYPGWGKAAIDWGRQMVFMSKRADNTLRNPFSASYFRWFERGSEEGGQDRPNEEKVGSTPKITQM